MKTREAQAAAIALLALAWIAGAARAGEGAQASPHAATGVEKAPRTEGGAGRGYVGGESEANAQGERDAAVDAGDLRPSPQPPGRQTSPQAKPDDAGYLAYEGPGLPESPGLATVAGRVLGSLAVVIGLIVATALGLKRYLGGTKAPTTSRKVSELVEVTPLGGKRYLYLIRVADRLLVVGAGGDRLSLLSEISDPEVLERVASLPRRSDFFELLHRARAGVGRHAQRPEQAVAG